MAQREHLSAVGERHRTFTGTVERSEKVDEERHKAQVCWVFLRDEETEASGQERPGHIRESEQEQRTAAERVDGPNCRPSEDEVHQTEAEGRDQCFSLTGTAKSEHSAAVERDDIDTTLGRISIFTMPDIQIINA